MKITREHLKNIVKETMIEESEYQEFFKKALEKAGKSIPAMSDEEKKAFFNKIEKTWKGKGQKSEGNAFGAAVAKAKKDGDDSFEVDGKEYKTERFGRGHEGPTFGSEEESVNEVDTKKANILRKNMPGYVGPKFAKKASDEDLLAMADLKDEKAQLYNRYLKDVMSKISKLQKKYNIKESVNEGNKPKFKVGDVVKYKGAKVSAKVLKVMPTNWENGYLIQFQDNKKKEEAGESSLVKESTNEGISVFDERHFGKKGIIIMIDDNGKKVSAIFKDKKNADKYNRNNPSDIRALLKIAKTKPFGKAIDESVINEGPSTEEKRIAMLAVRKQAKYRNVSLEQAIQDQINALEDLKRDVKKGKLK